MSTRKTDNTKKSLILLQKTAGFSIKDSYIIPVTDTDFGRCNFSYFCRSLTCTLKFKMLWEYLENTAGICVIFFPPLETSAHAAQAVLEFTG